MFDSVWGDQWEKEEHIVMSSVTLVNGHKGGCLTWWQREFPYILWTHKTSLESNMVHTHRHRMKERERERNVYSAFDNLHLLLFYLTLTAFPSHALFLVTFWIQLALLVYMWVWGLYTLECGQPHARGHSSWKKTHYSYPAAMKWQYSLS